MASVGSFRQLFISKKELHAGHKSNPHGSPFKRILSRFTRSNSTKADLENLAPKDRAPSLDSLCQVAQDDHPQIHITPMESVQFQTGNAVAGGLICPATRAGNNISEVPLPVYNFDHGNHHQRIYHQDDQGDHHQVDHQGGYSCARA